jgi:acetyl-CoA carboxylase carboxyltransferase component
VDGGDFLEVQKYWAKIYYYFSRKRGILGIMAYNPEILAGVLDIDPRQKPALLIPDCFNIPHCLRRRSGFLPGTNQEWVNNKRQRPMLFRARCPQ